MPPRSHPRPPVAASRLNPAGDTMWTNLGDWRGGGPYPRAAAALAQRVGDAAHLRPDDVVVDYACGYGDSLRLWIERFGVRRVVGVEPSPDVCAVLRQRIRDWGLEDRVTLRQSRAEDLRPREADAEATAVLCVDAAYHFQTRLAWWAMVAADLPRGARIACADLLLADAATPSTAVRLAAAGMGIPRENLMDVARFRRHVAELPLDDLRAASIGADVLDGFAAHVPARGLAVRLTRAVIRALRLRPSIEYLILSGQVAEA